MKRKKRYSYYFSASFRPIISRPDILGCGTELAVVLQRISDCPVGWVGYLLENTAHQPILYALRRNGDREEEEKGSECTFFSFPRLLSSKNDFRGGNHNVNIFIFLMLQREQKNVLYGCLILRGDNKGI